MAEKKAAATRELTRRVVPARVRPTFSCWNEIAQSCCTKYVKLGKYDVICCTKYVELGKYDVICCTKMRENMSN